MTPNLLLVAKKAITPWKWGSSKKSNTNNTRKIYFSHKPVAGIYALTAEKKRYLVALRPSGKKDDENIFRRLTLKEHFRLISIRSPIEVNETSPTNNNKGAARNILEFGRTESVHCEDNIPAKDIELRARHYRSRDEAFECRPNSSRSQSSSSDNTCLSIGTRAIKPAPLVTRSNTALEPENRYTRYTSLSCQEKVGIISFDRSVHSVEDHLKNDGTLPHQDPPLGQKHKHESFHSPSTFGFDKHRYAVQGIQRVDLNGYKFLRQPLRIESCTATKRWMFSSEVRARKLVAPMCKNVNCMAEDMSLCGKTVNMELFVLDDAESYVVTGTENHGHVSKRWKEHIGGTGRLYCVDEKTKCIRRQTIAEVKHSRLRLAMEQGRFLVHDNNAAHTPVIRYLGLKYRRVMDLET